MLHTFRSEHISKNIIPNTFHVGIDFSASLEASSLPRGSRSSDLRQLKRRGRTAARDGAARLRLPLWRTGPVTVWGAGGRPPKVAAMGMSRSWRGGAVLPPGRQDLGHQRVCDVQRRSARDPCPHAVSGTQMAQFHIQTCFLFRIARIGTTLMRSSAT